MEKGNGKIAIAIVAMFVVALSVVGFTYAYFVASVNGNTKENVRVTAGILEVEYKGAKSFTATNVVPGWVSDGKHYFSSTGFTTDAQGNKQYSACECAAAITEQNTTCTNATTETKACTTTDATTANGIANALEFTVGSSDRNTGKASYVIILNGIANGIADKTNLTYTLYADGTAINKGVVADSGVQVISDVKISDVTDEDVTYKVEFTYANDATDQKSQGATFSATAEIVGVTLQEDKYYDANGVEITPATESVA